MTTDTTQTESELINAVRAKAFDVEERGLNNVWTTRQVMLSDVVALIRQHEASVDIFDPVALSALRDHQRQLDTDGVEVGVSREALDMAIAFIDEIEKRTLPETGLSPRELAEQREELLGALEDAIGLLESAAVDPEYKEHWTKVTIPNGKKAIARARGEPVLAA